MKNKLLIKLISFLFGALAGWAVGFMIALNLLIDRASKFIQVDKVLIREYLFRTGLS